MNKEKETQTIELKTKTKENIPCIIDEQGERNRR